MTLDSLSCVQITLDQGDELGEALVESALWALEPQGVERQDDETWSELVEDPRPRAAGAVRWRIHRSGTSAPAFEEDVRRVLPSLDGLHIAAWEIDDLSFMHTWKEFFRPARVSPRIIVHPPWDVPEAPERVRLVMVEPGMAFGTGTHETTRLCIRALDERLKERTRSVLDVGTGSGILAIAAAHLGAQRVVGVENDPHALVIARENARLNGVASSISFPDTQVSDLDEPAELVLANILPHVLLAIREHLYRLVMPGGHLVLSGILVTERAGVEDAFAGRGMELVDAPVMGEWCALVFQRPAE
ncbi:MAG: 50S ribosomal protein L11 methyltransferase [Deltaproteobacteria bacterium]|nr:MAG: 50S ribosomal protein L11 methyltransferase [Deltaproteobacteria bacterium]